jgi:lipoprotein-anchoring transpeptidase ErfK/SrfK
MEMRHRAIMKIAMKWIGGAACAAVMALGGITLAGVSMSESATANSETTVALTAQRVGMDDTTAGNQSAAAPAVFEGPTAAIAGKMALDAEKRAASQFTVKRILPIEGPMKYGEWHWDTEGVPETGKLIMTVDLEARVISVFRDGYEIGAAVAMLGTVEHPTPVGTFPILTKERHNVSEKYGNAPMPWTLRLTWDGIAIHGGSEVENGYASHGCIAVPDGFADKLYAIAKKGDIVVITDGKRIGMGDAII